MGELAADARIHVIAQHRRIAVYSQGDLCNPLTKTGGAAFDVCVQRITFRRNQIGELEIGFERCTNRSNLGFDDRGEFVVGKFFHRLATIDALRKNFGIVERLPHRFAARPNAILARLLHAHPP